MSRHHGRRVRWLAAAMVVALGSSLAVATSAGADTATTLAQRITALAGESRNWRAELASPLAGLRGTHTVTGKVSGSVAAGTVTLPASIELAGKTTIIARDIVVATGTVRVHSNGHALRLYPVTSLRSGTKATTASGTDATVNATTIDTSGQPGTFGLPGFIGESGDWGLPGFDGAHGYDLDHCDGEPGGPGGDGGWGTDGGTGLPGGNGTNAGPINVDIPDGSTETYHLIARGGNGGQGGAGGLGGYGGYGGSGGAGGSSFFDCFNDGWGGRGGDGGGGGFAGWGGDGGRGGVGGRGGDVTVEYGGDLDFEQVFVDSAGGAAGVGGFPGFGGLGGWGGVGGSGGMTHWLGRSEPWGWDGGFGADGQPGSFGLPGASGAAGEEKLLRRWEYVALGDSYSSGLGVGEPYLEGTSEEGCAKSSISYPQLLANNFSVLRHKAQFYFRACAGATTATVLQSQLGTLDQGMSYVTISIGGNDLGFPSMVDQCVRADCSGLTVDDATLAGLAVNLRAVYREIIRLSPNARHMVVLYPQILPVRVNAFCPFGIEQAEADAIRRVWDRANAKIREVALAERMEVLDAMANAFEGNSICSLSPMANGVVINMGGPSRESYHPNGSGHHRMYTLLWDSGTIPQ